MSLLTESSNTLILLLLGLAALYFILSPAGSKKRKGKASTANATTGTEQARRDPLIYRDDETGEYFIDEDGSGAPRAITREEFYALTGTRPEQVNDPAAEVVLEDPALPAVPAPTAGGGVIGPEDFEDLAQDQVDVDLERANLQLPQAPAAGGAGPGPATAAASSQTRVVGAKKAKSLERKDQRRAFFEHQRFQALADRQDAAEFERQYGDLISAEREVRREREEAAESARRAERERVKLEERALKLERDRVRRTVQDLGQGATMRLRTELEKEVAATVAGSGSGSATATPFVVSNGDWIVRFSEAELDQVGNAIKEKGSMTYEELASKLTAIKR